MKNYYFIILLIVSCTSNNLNLEQFNDQQKKTLVDLLKQNDNNLIKSFKSSNANIGEVYYEYIERLNLKSDPNEISKNIFIKDKQLVDELIKLTIFNKSNIKVYKSNTNINGFNINLKGNYIEFLEFNAKSNKSILDYFNSVKSTGSLSPSSTKILLTSFDKKDLMNENIRLILCVHFLLVNNS